MGNVCIHKLIKKKEFSPLAIKPQLEQACLRALIAGVELVLGQREIGAYQNGVAAC